MLLLIGIDAFVHHLVTIDLICSLGIDIGTEEVILLHLPLKAVHIGQIAVKVVVATPSVTAEIPQTTREVVGEDGQNFLGLGAEVVIEELCHLLGEVVINPQTFLLSPQFLCIYSHILVERSILGFTQILGQLLEVDFVQLAVNLSQFPRRCVIADAVQFIGKGIQSRIVSRGVLLTDEVQNGSAFLSRDISLIDGRGDALNFDATQTIDNTLVEVDDIGASLTLDVELNQILFLDDVHSDFSFVFFYSWGLPLTLLIIADFFDLSRGNFNFF